MTRLDIPEFQPKVFEADDCLDQMTDKLSMLLHNDVPAIMIRAAGNDLTDLTIAAFEDMGLACKPDDPTDISDMRIGHFKIGKTFLPFKRRHIEYSGYPHGPNPSVTIRQHDAKRGLTRVTMRQAKLHNFSHQSRRLHSTKDRTQPIYEALQRSGDRLLFVVFGGVLASNGEPTLPAEHKFVPANRLSRARIIRTCDLEVSSAQTKAA